MDKKNNIYINALKRRFENKPNSSKNIYMYEVYEELISILDCLEDYDSDFSCMFLNNLINELSSTIDSNNSVIAGLNKKIDLRNELIPLLNGICYIPCEEEEEYIKQFDYLIEETKSIIKKYFPNKNKEYLNKYNKERKKKYKSKSKRSKKHKKYIELYKKGYRKVDIAKEMNVSKSAVTLFYKRNVKEINDINETYLKLYQQGYDKLKIAQEMNVTPSDVINFYKINYNEIVNFL